jgi:NAD(P)-dependent dehydrogenase (short-subunit alcohol dehydrogenase family)
MNIYQDLFRFDNQVVVVTGAAGLLGSEFCKAFCALGAMVICIDVQKDSLSNLLKKLTTAAAFPCDISNPKEVNDTVSEIVNQYSKVDVLINNAATKTPDLQDFFTPFSDYSLDAWRSVMSVNLDGMFLMAQAIGKNMIERQRGAIVQTASIYSLLGADQRIYEGSKYLDREINTPAVYTASKAGVIGLTKHLATLWGEKGVRVNALCPGGVSSGQNDEFHKKYSARVPMGRMAKEMDIVGPMLFLASEASSYMTGQTLFIDGGLSAW